MARRMYEGEAARAELIGPRECAYWRRALDRAKVVRWECPEQFFDVEHRRFHADPLGTVRSIYEYFGLSLSSHAESRMRTWIAASPTSRHGEHRYRLDQYGVTAAEVRGNFAEYRTQHEYD
jgi:hypothetical protein